MIALRLVGVRVVRAIEVVHRILDGVSSKQDAVVLVGQNGDSR